IRSSAQYLGQCMTLAASVAFFGWIGLKVGTLIGAESLLTILGALLGGAVSWYSLIAKVKKGLRQGQGREESDEH
ncbi:MAG: hypothetical protein IH921_01115, partial [Gemmatimonadetes bacterium]|nr:hypothetical protein [Gemmatimonadota bacterium]